jgi:hypothetical protein
VCRGRENGEVDMSVWKEEGEFREPSDERDQR